MNRAVLLVVLTVGYPAIAQLPPAPESGTHSGDKKPMLFVQQRAAELGALVEGDVRQIQWMLENRGEAPLVIERTQSTCGCTIVKLRDEEKTIPPGGSLTLMAEFNSTARAGKQNKKIKIFSNDPVEPELHLSFTASVEPLYSVKPAKIVNIRGVRRGEQVSHTIDFVAAPDRKAIEQLELEFDEEGPLTFSQEPFVEGKNRGVRVRMTVGDYVGIGPLSTSVTAKIRVDGIERERTMPVRGRVVGSLTWTPLVVDETRTRVRPGKRFAPITVKSSENAPFEIVDATCGEYLDVNVETPRSARKPTQYTFQLTARDGAPIGPFATELVVRTNVLDQPVIRVPVFGIVAAPLDIDPPVVLLRQDGTDVGMRRRIKLQALPQVALDVTGITCSEGAVTAAVDLAASASHRHLRMIEVRLTGKLPKGTHEAVLTVSTSVSGAEELKIPVVITVPD